MAARMEAKRLIFFKIQFDFQVVSIPRGIYAVEAIKRCHYYGRKA